MRLTYAQRKSEAQALVRKAMFENGKNIKVLIFKDSGGDYDVRELRNGETICYTSLKAIVYINHKGDIVTEVSRETISKLLEEYNINFIYFKLD